MTTYNRRLHKAAKILKKQINQLLKNEGTDFEISLSQALEISARQSGYKSLLDAETKAKAKRGGVSDGVTLRVEIPLRVTKFVKYPVATHEMAIAKFVEEFSRPIRGPFESIDVHDSRGWRWHPTMSIPSGRLWRKYTRAYTEDSGEFDINGDEGDNIKPVRYPLDWED